MLVHLLNCFDFFLQFFVVFTDYMFIPGFNPIKKNLNTDKKSENFEPTNCSRNSEKVSNTVLVQLARRNFEDFFQGILI